MGIGNEFIGNVEQLVVNDVINSKKLFRFSKEDYFSYSHIFEREVKEMFGVSGALLFPSATLALTAFLKTLNLSEGDEVIIPSFSWVADYSALLFEGLKLRFCRMEENFSVPLDSIKELVNSNTKIVLVPHLMGRGQQEILSISEFCNENNLILIEDIAQSFGVKVKGKYAGSFGDFSFSSFNHHKILSCGDGGVGIVKDSERYFRLCQIHDQGCFIKEGGKRGINRDLYLKGLSLRNNNLVGAVALAQLAKFNYIKHSINAKHNEVIFHLGEEERRNLIPMNDGDIAYTLLMKSEEKKDYPSLLESGLHFIENIPYFSDLVVEDLDKRNIDVTKKVFAKTYAVGTGFIDEYYAIKKGFKMEERVSEENIKEIMGEIL